MSDIHDRPRYHAMGILYVRVWGVRYFGRLVNLDSMTRLGPSAERLGCIKCWHKKPEWLTLATLNPPHYPHYEPLALRELPMHRYLVGFGLPDLLLTASMSDVTSSCCLSDGFVSKFWPRSALMSMFTKGQLNEPYGELSKLWSLLGPYYNTGPNLGDPKSDHNFDSSPYTRRWRKFCISPGS